MNIGKAIRLCRTQKNMSLTKLAIKAKVTISHLSLIERNKCSTGINTLKKIAKGLNIPLSVLIFLASDKNELKGINADVVDQLSKTILKLIN